MAITITKLNPDVDITRLIDISSFEKQDNLTSQVDTCKFIIKKYGTRTYIPALGQVIKVMNEATKVFEGTIEKIVKRSEGIKIALYECECKDYTQILDRKLVAEAYTNQTPLQIITSLKNTYFPTFTITNVANPSITVEYIYFDYIQPSKALQQLAELINYDWYVDYDKDIHFFAKSTGETAPFDVTDTNGKCINESLEIAEDTRQIKNTIYVRGGEYVGSTVSDKVGEGDGTKKIFNLPYRYDVTPTVTVNAVSKTVGVDYLDDPASYDCLWNYQEKVIKFTVAPASGDVVVAGTPLIIVLIKASNSASVNQYGTYEFKIIDKTIKTKEAARRRAQAEISDYAQSLQEAKFQTYADGLRSGMKININSAILEVNEDFIINRVSVRMFSHEDFIYEVSLVTTRTMGIIAYLQKQLLDLDKKVGVFKQEDTVIDTIKDLQDIDTVSITESLLNAGIDDPPIWTISPYSPISSLDRRRPARAGRGCLVIDGLIGHWKLDESSGLVASDSSGKGNNGALEASMTDADWIAGKLGNALDFDGIDDYVVINAGNAIAFGNALTLSAWFYANTLPAGNMGIIERWNDLGIRWNSSGGFGRISAYIDTDAGSPSAGELNGAYNLNKDTWYHIVFTWDGSTEIIYINGAIYAQKSWGGNFQNSVATFYIGAITASYEFDGIIDDVRIYNRALSLKEVISLIV